MRSAKVLISGLVLLCIACGVHKEEPLPATGRILKAAVETYGWTSFDLGQDIAVTLASNVALGDVLDMSVFGPFTPGSNSEDALRSGGPPSRTRTDEWGEVWQIYDLPKSRVEIGCYYYTSGGTPTSCAWTLYAVPKVDPTTLLLDPQLQGYLRRAIGSGVRVSSRSLEVTTADGVQQVELFVTSRLGPGLYWTDRRMDARREGSPKRAAQR